MAETDAAQDPRIFRNLSSRKTAKDTSEHG